MACPRAGRRVRFRLARPNYYTTAPRKRRGVGVVTAIPGRQTACLPGPRGGLVYVCWRKGHCEAVFQVDLLLRG